MAAGMVVESGDFYKDIVATDQNARGPTGISQSRRLLDLRGVGDSSWAAGGPAYLWSHIPKPLGTGSFAAASWNVSPERFFTSGHLNYVSFETAVSTECTQIGKPEYYFLTDPEQIRQANEMGFNLFSLANNHAYDCLQGPDFNGKKVSGPLMTASYMQHQASIAQGNGLLWHGTGEDPMSIAEKEFTFNYDVKDQTVTRNVRVAFAGLSLGLVTPGKLLSGADATSWASVEKAIRPLMENFDRSSAQLKILAIHSQDGTEDRAKEQKVFLALKRVAEIFITKHGGQVVFGSGPHTGAGIKVYEKPDGSRGVVFTSLGNFIHPGLLPTPDNYVARVLFDPETLVIKEIHAIPFSTEVEGRNISARIPGTPSLSLCSAENLQRLANVDPTKPATWPKQDCAAPIPSNFPMRIGQMKVRGEAKALWWAAFP